MKKQVGTLSLLLLALVVSLNHGIRSAAAQESVKTAQAPAATTKTEDCGCSAEKPPDVLAMVNGVAIKKQEVYPPLEDRIRQLQQGLVDARNQELSRQVNALLLNDEATKRGLTLYQLLEAEVTSKVPNPTETEVRMYYDENKAQLGSDYREVRPSIQGFLREQRRQAATSQFADRLRATSKVELKTTNPTPPEKDADRDRVFATVNGKAITSGNIEDALKPTIFQVNDDIYRVVKAQLDVLINDQLLEQEARKRQTTGGAILATEVSAKFKKATDAEIRDFWDKNKERIGGSFEERRDDIARYLEQQQLQSAQQTFFDSLKKAGEVKIYLPEPEPPVLRIATDDQPSTGDPNARVIIIEFTDYECPSCGATQPIVDKLLAEFSGKVRLFVRDFPLDRHVHARSAAEAAEAAREQGKYWEYVHLLFQNQKALEPANLRDYAARIGLDLKKFDADVQSGRMRDRVWRDMQDGLTVGVDATPTLFINGKRVRSTTYEGLKAAIESALKGGA
ncbi:MAG TPA: thioredoxin domain-containing protein [Blastocatellia bacterium]|nr:thioredoxin domain-containing protein [Blastocatellia bacterium]